MARSRRPGRQRKVKVNRTAPPAPPASVSGSTRRSKPVERRLRSLVLRNLLSTGFDLRVEPDTDAGGAGGAVRFTFTFRWRPGRRERAMALALRSRFHL